MEKDDESIDPKYLVNLENSIYFEKQGPIPSMAEKIKIHNKREEYKQIALDSRIDDSRKYLIKNEMTPEFINNEVSAFSIDIKREQNSNPEI